MIYPRLAESICLSTVVVVVVVVSTSLSVCFFCVSPLDSDWTRHGNAFLEKQERVAHAPLRVEALIKAPNVLISPALQKGHHSQSPKPKGKGKEEKRKRRNN